MDQLSLSVAESNEFLAVIEVVSDDMERSSMDRDMAVAMYMLSNGISKDQLMTLFEVVCPPYNKDKCRYRLFEVGSFINRVRLSIYTEIFKTTIGGGQVDSEAIVRQRIQDRLVF